jgi:hypothetical protein
MRKLADLAAGMRRTFEGALQHERGSMNGAGARGDFLIELFGPDGKRKAVRHVSNLVVNDGLNWLKDYCFNSATTQTQMGHIAIGTDSTTETATDSALGAELAKQAVSAYTPGGVGVLTVETTFAAGVGTGAIVEAGLFDQAAASTGDMWNRATFAVVNKAAGDTLKITITCTFTAT